MWLQKAKVAFFFPIQLRSSGFLVAQMIKNLPANAGDMRHSFHTWVEKISWRRAWQPTPLFLPGESHGQRSLVGYSPRGCRELDMAEPLSAHAADLHIHRNLLFPGDLKRSPGILPPSKLEASELQPPM